jgi:hypothetical protein
VAKFSYLLLGEFRVKERPISAGGIMEKTQGIISSIHLKIPYNTMRN